MIIVIVSNRNQRESLSEVAEENREIFKYEKVLTERKLVFNQYDSNPTKLAKLQHREKVFVYVTETYSGEENGDFEPYPMIFFPFQKYLIQWLRDSAGNEINKLKEKVNVCKGEDCVDKMLTHKYKKWKVAPKVIKNRIITRYDNKLFAHNAVDYDNWVIL